MIDAMKASNSLAKATLPGCRKRDQTSGGDGDGSPSPPPESKIRPLRYGYVSILGRRRAMEDPVMVMPPRRLPGGYSFFAAYGCGGGATVAYTCTEKLHECLEKHTVAAEEGLGWGKVVMDCFSSIYEDWSGPAAMRFTAVVAAVEKGEVVVVNCGGSRAVLWSGGVAVPLGTDHNHNKPDEADESVEDLASTSTSQGGDESARRREPGPEAEVRVMRRDDDGDSEAFLIIASDGLWKVVGKEMACEVVRSCLAGKMRRLPSEGGGGDAVSQATAVLAELAIAKGSNDNIAIVVLQFN